MPVGSNFSVLSRNCLHFNLLLKEQKPIFRGKKSCLWFLPLPVYVFPSHLLISLYTAAWGEGQLRVSSQLLWGEHIPQTKFGTRLFSTHFFFFKQRLDLRGPLPSACFSLSSSGACCPPSFLSVFLLYQILEEKQLDSSSITLFLPISVLQINFRMLLT